MIILGFAGMFFGPLIGLVPGHAEGSGILVIGLYVLGVGALLVMRGLSLRDLLLVRAGLTIDGGFVAAALIMLADYLIKALEAG